TIVSRDWSSDVCSSDLQTELGRSRPSATTDVANAVLFRAMSLVGTPYRYGGNTPESGFDCSGLVGYVFRDAAGIALPRTTSDIEIGRASCRRRSRLMQF